MRSATKAARAYVEAAIIFAIGLCLVGIVYNAAGFGLWQEDMPGAGLYPALVASICVAICVAEAALTFRREAIKAEPAEAPEFSVKDVDWRRLGIYGLAFVVQVFGFAPLGFFLSSGITSLVVMIGAERVPLWRALIVVSVMLGGAYVLFVRLLSVQFPASSLLNS